MFKWRKEIKEFIYSSGIITLCSILGVDGGDVVNFGEVGGVSWLTMGGNGGGVFSCGGSINASLDFIKRLNLW